MRLMAFDPFTLKELIREHGINVTLRKRTAGSYNNDTGTVTQSTTDYTVRGYFYNYTLSAINGVSILSDDRGVVLDYTLSDGTTPTPAPDATDQIIGFGSTLDIVNVSEIKSGNATMCYQLQVRG